MEGGELLRPPLGFIVEGKGEYYCYPSLVARILDARGFKIPVSNASGNGNILGDLPRLLDGIVLTNHPFVVIITLDLRDVVRAQLFADCEALVVQLRDQIDSWFHQAQDDPRLGPLPDAVSVVVQIQQFESWFIADLEPLVDEGLVRPQGNEYPDVDNEIQAPATWLANNTTTRFNLKNPQFARRVVSLVNPDNIRQRSRSFDKFSREVALHYGRWLEATGIDPQSLEPQDT